MCETCRPTEDELFFEITKSFAKRSTCLRQKVGAVIVKEGRIIATGYNGAAPGTEHCYDYFKSVYYEKFKIKRKDFEGRPIKVVAIDAPPFILWIKSKEFYDLHREFSIFEHHAEMNCISFAAKNGIATEGSTLYCSLSPCLDCGKMISAAGIKKVLYLELYDRDQRGIEHLKKCGIECLQFL